MKKVLLFLKKEILEVLPPTIYFFVVFHILALVSSITANEYGVSIPSMVYATIGAIIVAKAILIADAFPFLKKLGKERLIYNVAWRVLIYAALAMLFQLLEDIIPLISKYKSFGLAWEHYITETNWIRFWAVHLIFILFLLVYVVLLEIKDAIGRDKFRELFFGKKN